MSVKITLTVDVLLETIAAFNSGAGREQAVEAVTESVAESVVKQLEAIPYTRTPKIYANGPTNTKAERAATSKLSAATLASIRVIAARFWPKPKPDLKPAPRPDHEIEVLVRTVSGKLLTIPIENHCDWSGLALEIEKLEGIPQHHMCLLYRGCDWLSKKGVDQHGSPFRDYTLRESDIRHRSVVDLVLPLGGPQNLVSANMRQRSNAWGLDLAPRAPRTPKKDASGVWRFEE